MCRVVDMILQHTPRTHSFLLPPPFVDGKTLKAALKGRSNLVIPCTNITVHRFHTSARTTVIGKWIGAPTLQSLVIAILKDERGFSHCSVRPVERHVDWGNGGLPGMAVVGYAIYLSW
jgi:hypothetical protein